MVKFKYYLISWIVLLAAFNAISFVCATQMLGTFTNAFWIGYAFISVAFIGQLICASYAFKSENLTKAFYNLPILTESWSALILMFVFGGITMALPNIIPVWPAVILCIAILALSAITVFKAAATADVVGAIDSKLADDTAFIRNLTKEAELLVNRAPNPEIKAECVRVYEAIRYSPKRSKPSVAEIENEMKQEFLSLEMNVTTCNYMKCIENRKRIIELLGNRSK